MVSKKEYIKKRWLYFIAIAFTFIVPLVILFEGIFTIKKVDEKITLQLSGLIVGMVYLGVVLKFFYKKIILMKPSIRKIILEKSTLIAPFLIVACLVYLVERVLQGFDYYLAMVCGSMVIGMLLEVIEFAINRKFLYKLRIYEMAKEQVDIEKEKKKLEEEAEKVEEDE